jgi:hypothetical protein
MATAGAGGTSAGVPDDYGSAGSVVVTQAGAGGAVGGGGSPDPGLVAGAGVGGAVDPNDGGAGGEAPAVRVPTFVAAADGMPVQPIVRGVDYAWELAVGDLNGDGHLDLVSGRDFDGAAVALGKGDGTFQSAGLYAGTTQSEDTSVFGLGLVDLDRDGDLDLAIATSFPGVIRSPIAWDC